MNNIFEQLFEYGFHDTELTSISGENLEIRLNFNEGIYLLDETGKETTLSQPIQMVLNISSYYNSFHEALEIKEYGKKIKYLDFSMLKKFLQKKSMGISMVYYSHFNNCLLLDGGVYGKNIMISIEGISKIFIHELKNSSKN